MKTTVTSEKVVVCVRIRPALEREVNDKISGYNSCIGLQDKDVFVIKRDMPVLIDEDGGLMSGQDSAALDRFRFDHSFGIRVNTKQIYRTVCKGIIPSICEGKNQTIFAYGQTGSGKTYTMFNDEDAVVKMFAKELFKENMIEEINVSYMQIYNKSISDLIKPCNNSSLKVRENVNLEGAYVEGLSRVKVKSEEELMELIEKGLRNRKTIETKLNSYSSRSHVILTFYIELGGNDSFAKVNIVDLAGSERVKDSGVIGENFNDATNINSSLLALSRVVRAINDKNAKYIPYRDNPLCLVLKDALGGNCKTTLIATVSPSTLHCQETVSTLRFGTACSHVRNHVKQNSQRKSIKSLWANGNEDKKMGRQGKKKKVFPWKHLNINSQGGRIYLDTSFGKISALAYGNPSNPLVICLHGSPSEAAWRYGDFLLKSLVYSNFYAVAIDMPGCGRSEGKALKCRSEYILKDGQAGEFVDEVRKRLGAKKYSIVGYDWGAGICLAMATSKKYNNQIKNVVSFHPPAMNDYFKDEYSIKK